MSRAVENWVGATDDAKIPPRVRLRVFERFGGVCQLSGRKIRAGEPWQVDHKTALINGGKHEEANLQPVLVDAHKVKTRDDLALKSKVYRTRLKHLGQWPKGPKIQSRGFQKRRVPSGALERQDAAEDDASGMKNQ